MSINVTSYFTPLSCVHCDLPQDQSFSSPMFIIKDPLKIWRPKVKHKYTSIGNGTDIDGGIFDYTNYGNTVFKPKLDWNNHKITDIVRYDHEKYWAELKKGINIVKNAYPYVRANIIGLIKKYWGWFCKIGASRTIIGYQFSIDTGFLSPVCFHKPQYSPRGSVVIMDKVGYLMNNNCIPRT